MHSDDLACARVNLAFQGLTVKRRDGEQFRREMPQVTDRGNQHTFIARQPHTHIAVPAMREHPTLSQALRRCNHLRSLFWITFRHDVLSLL